MLLPNELFKLVSLEYNALFASSTKQIWRMSNHANSNIHTLLSLSLSLSLSPSLPNKACSKTKTLAFSDSAALGLCKLDHSEFPKLDQLFQESNKIQSIAPDALHSFTWSNFDYLLELFLFPTHLHLIALHSNICARTAQQTPTQLPMLTTAKTRHLSTR